MTKDFLSLSDWSLEDLEKIFTLARELKAKQKEGTPHRLLEGQTLGTHLGDWVPFEFEVGANALSRTLEVVVRGLPEHPTRGFLPTCGLVHRGLWQPVTFEGTGPWRLGRDDLSVREEDGHVLVKASVDGPSGHR